MGVRFVVTGFSSFPGVAANPTEEIVKNLSAYIEKRGGILGGGALSCCQVLKVAAKEVDEWLSKEGLLMCEECLDGIDEVVWVHLGVNSHINCFHIEDCAVNNATFRVPDEDGWQPSCRKIDSSPGMELETTLESDLDIKGFVGQLASEGFQVDVSHDAGTYLCNWIYFESLEQCMRIGNAKWHAMFVHVPEFECINQERQMEFVGSLLDYISMQLSGPESVQKFMDCKEAMT